MNKINPKKIILYLLIIITDHNGSPEITKWYKNKKIIIPAAVIAVAAIIGRSNFSKEEKKKTNKNIINENSTYLNNDIRDDKEKIDDITDDKKKIVANDNSSKKPEPINQNPNTNGFIEAKKRFYFHLDKLKEITGLDLSPTEFKKYTNNSINDLNYSDNLPKFFGINEEKNEVKKNPSLLVNSKQIKLIFKYLSEELEKKYEAINQETKKIEDERKKHIDRYKEKVNSDFYTIDSINETIKKHNNKGNSAIIASRFMANRSNLTVFGDVHGTELPVEALLKKIEEDENRYFLFIGDIIDKNHSPCHNFYNIILIGLILLSDLDKNIMIIRGNHECNETTPYERGISLLDSDTKNMAFSILSKMCGQITFHHEKKEELFIAKHALSVEPYYTPLIEDPNIFYKYKVYPPFIENKASVFLDIDNLSLKNFNLYKKLYIYSSNEEDVHELASFRCMDTNPPGFQKYFLTKEKSYVLDRKNKQIYTFMGHFHAYHPGLKKMTQGLFNNYLTDAFTLQDPTNKGLLKKDLPLNSMLENNLASFIVPPSGLKTSYYYQEAQQGNTFFETLKEENKKELLDKKVFNKNGIINHSQFLIGASFQFDKDGIIFTGNDFISN